MMKKQMVKNFFMKAMMLAVAIILSVSVAWFFDGESNIAYAATDDYYFTEPAENGVTITENMTAPKPNTEGKETYIFAGYYAEETCETPITETTSAKVYKKFVPADIMTVKAQVTKGTAEDTTKTDMRLVTTVDGLNYKEVGFDVYFNGSKTAVNAKTTTVYKRIIAADSGNAFGYSPEAFSTDAEYFTTVNLVNIANKNFDKTFFIKPYWKTLDGTKVYGMSRMARVSDSYNGIANVPVRLYTDATVSAGTFSVAYDKNILSYIGYDNGDVYASVEAVDDTANAKVSVTTPSEVAGADSMVANLRFQVKEGQTMPSNSTFDVTGDFGTAIASVEYKVFSVTYNGVADTSWYDEFKDGNEFVITTPADFYGFAKIVNASSGEYKTELFAEDTVRLGADIVINRGLATANGWDKTKDVNENTITNGTEYKWTPIGFANTFAGTFDGCGNTIEGIYMIDNYENRTSSSSHFSGLFGLTTTGSTIRNFKLINSYFESTTGSSTSYAFMGSVVGQLNGGDLESVYSNAYIYSEHIQLGGIVGRTRGTSTITNCWYDGEINMHQATCTTQVRLGGIVGHQFDGVLVVTDCLNTANITYTADAYKDSTANPSVGMGGIYGYGNGTLNNCINAGTISATITGKSGVNHVGSIAGWVATKTNCVEAHGTSTANYNGYKGYSALKDTYNFYNSETKDGNWVCRATADSAIDGIPTLKSFCDEWIDVSWYYDDKEAEEFTISSAEALYGWSELSNKASISFASDVTVKLGADIKMNSGNASVWATTTNTNITDALRRWTPIKSFAGTFDGQMNTISGVYLNTSSQKAGLFAEQTGTVSNFYLKNSYFNSTYNTGSTGANNGAYFGSVVGINRGTVNKVYSDAIVISAHSQVGGIVGRTVNASTIKECWFDGEVNLTTSNGWYSGGIVGYGYIEGGNTDVVFDIKDCLFTGTLTTQANAGTSTWGIGIGAFLGQTYSPVDFTVNIENCVSAGTINVPAATGSATGTGIIVGCIESARSHYIFTNVYGTNESCTKTQTPYYHRSGTNAPITGEVVMLAEADLQGAKGYKNTDLDFENTWAARKNQVSALAVFVDQSIDLTYAYKPDTSWYNAGAKVQEIQDEADMYGFLELMLDGNTFEGKEVHIKADLNMNHMEAETMKNWKDGKEVPVNEWLPATTFAGTFDGEMHTISGLYLNSTKAKNGLFGEITSKGKVSNFYITDSFFTSTGETISGYGCGANQTEKAAMIGSVAGVNNGTISTVYSDAIINSTGSRSGGIVGYMHTTANVDNCWFDGELHANSTERAGGIVGYLNGNLNTFNISDCLFTGELSYNKSSSGAWAIRIGGIVGGAWDYAKANVNVTNCVGAGSITGGTANANGVSSVYGGVDGASTLKFVNAYGTNESFATAQRVFYQMAGTGTVTGTGTMLARTDLQGTSGYQNTLLDFEETWVARKDNVPGLKAFTKVLGETVSIANVEQNNWYNANETVFGIGSASALKSLATYTNATNKLDFKAKTILLTDDIEINPVESGTLAAWKAGTGTLPTSWTPIGVGAAFNGTFDGQMHTISGLYMKNTSNTNKSIWTGLGMFAATNYYSNVQNFSLVDSYLEVKDPNGNSNSAGYIANLGSIVGYHHGYMNNVYSNATIVSNRSMVGGIMGYSNSRGVTNVWYDGNMTLISNHGREVGGIIGVMDSGNTFENILFTGKITFDATVDYAGIGGLFGITYTSSELSPLFKNVVIAGKLEKSQWANDIAKGSVAGLLFKATVRVENLYVTNENWSVTHNTYGSNTGTISGTITQLAEEDLKGGLAYVNTQLDFANTWVLRNNDVPGLKAFAENEVNVEDIIAPDTTWYDDEATTLQIQDEADMYGFMKLMNESKTFAGKTVTLEADLEMNAVDETTVKAWQAGTKVPANKWTVSNTSKYATFAGTFNGNDHTISGIYCVGDGIRTGLFGQVATDGSVKNFRITDSYFNHSNTTGYVGSVAAELYGPMENVYSDAIVDSKAQHTGGLVGIASGPAYSLGQKVTEDGVEYTLNSRYTRTVKNCWFDGELDATITKADTRVGGIVATVSQGKLNFENCLFTGNISVKDAIDSTTRVGGFVGSRTEQAVEKNKNKYVYVDETTGEQTPAYTTVNVDSCIAAGKIVVTGDTTARVGAAIGYADYGKFTDTFATRDTYPIPDVNRDTYEGDVIQSYNTDRLIGYCAEPTADAFRLDFEIDWSMRVSGVPVPKVFETCDFVKDQIVSDISKLDDELGLGGWNKTLADAVDYGMGNYVISADATEATYQAYLAKLDDELGFDCYTNNNASDMDDDGVYNAIYTKAEGDWVLNITYVKNKEKIYISISTIGVEGLDDNLKAPETEATNDPENTPKEVSFSMLQPSGDYGNSFVFRLPNGHFIINDGGKKKAYDKDGNEIINNIDPLLDYMQELAGTEKVVIDAWIFTHSHDDHIAVATDIFGNAEWKENVRLNAIYLTEANNATKLLEGVAERVIPGTNDAFRGLLSLTQDDNKSKPAIYRMHMGERYYFSGLTMDVVFAHEQIAFSEYKTGVDIDHFNTTSTNCVYTLTNTNKKILIGGDTNNTSMQYMMTAYGKSYTTYNNSRQQYGGVSETLANINYFVAYHHGKNAICKFESGKYPILIGSTYESIATNEWADYLLKNQKNVDGTNHKFDAVLFPWYQVFDVKDYDMFAASDGKTYEDRFGGDDGSYMYPYNISEINQYYIDNSKDKTYYTYGYQDHNASGNILNLEDLTRHGTVRLIFKEDKGVETTVYPTIITTTQ